MTFRDVAGPGQASGILTNRDHIPVQWRTVRLGAVADLLSGGTPSKNRPDWWQGSIPWASPKDMKRLRLRDTQDHISDEALKQGSRLVPPQTIFVVVRGMILAKELPVAMTEVPMAFNQDMKAILPRDEVESEYLLYALASRRPALLREIGTSAHGTRRIGSSSLDNLLLPLPPKGEQAAIAAVLRILEAAVETQDRIVATLKELKAATMAKLFREGFRGEPLKQTEIGEIPESWEVVRLESICKKLNYGTSVRCSLERVGRPVLRIPNIINERVETRELKYASLSEREIQGLTLRRGDLLFVRTNGNRGYTGRCAVYLGHPEEALFASYLIRARLVEGTVLPTFAQAYLSSAGREQITSQANPAADGKYNIDTQILKRLLLARPALAEQYQAVQVLEAIDLRLVTAERCVQVFRSLFSSTLHLLMTGQVRVPLTARVSGEGKDKGAGSPGPGTTGVDTSDHLPEAVERFVAELVRRFAPERVILFGSHAEGRATADSDVDLLVVMNFEGPGSEQAARMDAALQRDFPLDLLVRRPEAVEEALKQGDPFIKEIMEKGRALYARPE